MILAFLLGKKKNQTTNLPFLLVEVTDQLRIAYPPLSLEIGKTGQQKKSFCLYFAFILTKPCKQTSELPQKTSKIEDKYFFSLLHEFKAYPKVSLGSNSLSEALA